MLRNLIVGMIFGFLIVYGAGSCGVHAREVLSNTIQAVV